MSSNSAKPLMGARILVAEDDPVLAFDIVGELLKAGAEVAGPAFSLERTLELAASQELDCCVLDVRLRDGLVFPAAQILQEKGAGIVFYTGQLDPESLKKEWPAAQVLFKPVPMDVLIAAAIESYRQSLHA